MQDTFQKNMPLGVLIPEIAITIGNFWHIFAAFLILIIGNYKRNVLLIGAGVTAFQAVLSTFFVTTILKFLTGRRPPLYPVITDEKTTLLHSQPTNFAFDFWNHTLQDGRFFYPSGHTATIIAFVSALSAYYPEKKWIAWIGYPLVILMGLTMIAGSFHWTSDVVAGGIFGFIIGKISGKHFRKLYSEQVELKIQ